MELTTDPMPAPAAAPCTVCGEAFDTLDACATLCDECQRCEDAALQAEAEASMAVWRSSQATATAARLRLVAGLPRDGRRAIADAMRADDDFVQDRLLA